MADPEQIAAKIVQLADQCVGDIRTRLLMLAGSPDLYEIVLRAVQRKVMAMEAPKLRRPLSAQTPGAVR